jgi:hypothetical protein
MEEKKGIEELEKELIEIREKKKKYSDKGNYEVAARLRDDEKKLIKQIEELKK